MISYLPLLSVTAKNGLFTTLTYIFIHGCWLHFTGSMISSRAKFFSSAEKRRLRFVPLAVVFRRGMDVVGGGIVVLDLHGLSGHHAEHVGMILAALLIEHDRILGRIEGAVAQAVFHIDEDIGQVAAV